MYFNARIFGQFCVRDFRASASPLDLFRESDAARHIYNAQRNKLPEQLIDVSTSLVIGFNQLLELRQKIHSGPVQSHQLVELRANGYLELLKLDILCVRFRKPFRKSFKVDFG
jgi:hypothetical protein